MTLYKGRFTFLVLILLIFAGHSFIHAQEDETCAPFMGSPYAAAAEACASLGPNQICYGNPLVEAELIDPSLSFEAPGDMVDISAVESLTLSPETLTSSSGGIAYMRITDEEAGTDVYVVLYGVVTLTPDEDGGYLLETGEPPEGCTPFPSGALVYGTGETSIVINGVTLDVGTGIIHLATSEEGDLVITVLEGSADVISGDETVTLGIDESTTVTLDEDGLADSVPSEIAASELDVLDAPDDIFEGFPTGTEAGTENFMTFTAPDGTIIPTAGTWYLESYYISPVPVCPTGGQVQGAERQPPPTPRTAEFDFSDGVSLEAYLEQLTGSIPPATYDNPAPNVYTALGENEIEVSLYVMSESEMIFITEHWQVECRVQTVNWWMLQE